MNRHKLLIGRGFERVCVTRKGRIVDWQIAIVIAAAAAVVGAALWTGTTILAGLGAKERELDDEWFPDETSWGEASLGEG
jgi:hypothetical protein